MLEPRVVQGLKVEPVFSVNGESRSSQAYYALGRYHEGAQAWDQAVGAYRKAIAADAGNLDAFNALGVVLARRGRLDDAETTLRQAVAIDPGRSQLRNNLGYVLLLAGKPHDAVVELKSVVERDAGHAIAAANLRHALAQVQGGAAAEGTGGALDIGASARTATPLPARQPSAPETSAARPADAPPPARQAVTPPAFQIGYSPTVPPFERVGAGTAAPSPAPPSAVPAGAAVPASESTVTAPAVRATLPTTVVSLATGPAPEAVASRLEVSNGNGVAGMAARVGRWLSSQGLPTARLTNQPGFSQPTTVIQYRDGHEAAAMRVARRLPAHAATEVAPMTGQRSDVRLILGRDWVRTAACLEGSNCRPVAADLVANAPH